MAQAGARRMSGGEIAVVVVSSLLVVVFLVLLLGRVNSGDRDAAAGPTTPSATGPATAEATERSTEAPGEDLSAVGFDFVTPSGNIACAVDDERALCAIASFDYAEQIPEAETRACEGTVGHYVQVTAEGASLVCDTSGTAPAIDAAALPVLDYGTSETAHGFTCESSETGMTCTHEESGYSFSLRRAGYTFS